MKKYGSYYPSQWVLINQLYLELGRNSPSGTKHISASMIPVNAVWKGGTALWESSGRLAVWGIHSKGK